MVARMAASYKLILIFKMIARMAASRLLTTVALNEAGKGIRMTL